MSTSYRRDLLTGTTALLGVAGLILMLVLFGELRDVGTQRYSFTLRLDHVRGLSNISPVRLNGVPIGRISSMTTGPDGEGVDLTISINETVQIPRDFQVIIDQSLVGESALELASRGGSSASFVHGGDTIESRAIGFVDQITSRMEEPLTALADMGKSVDNLAEIYADVGLQLTELLAPRTDQDLADGAAPNLATTVTRMNRVLDNADAWLGDAALHGRVRALADRTDVLLTEASSAVGAWEETARRLEERTDLVAGDVRTSTQAFDEAMRALAGAADDFSTIATEFGRTDGTIGRLLEDPTLYLSLQDAVERVERTLLETELLIQKFRTEGVPITF